MTVLSNCDSDSELVWKVDWSHFHVCIKPNLSSFNGKHKIKHLPPLFSLTQLLFTHLLSHPNLLPNPSHSTHILSLHLSLSPFPYPNFPFAFYLEPFSFSSSFFVFTSVLSFLCSLPPLLTLQNFFHISSSSFSFTPYLSVSHLLIMLSGKFHKQTSYCQTGIRILYMHVCRCMLNSSNVEVS